MYATGLYPWMDNSPASEKDENYYGGGGFIAGGGNSPFGGGSPSGGLNVIASAY
jgi:hypothetical protein